MARRAETSVDYKESQYGLLVGSQSRKTNEKQNKKVDGRAFALFPFYPHVSFSRSQLRYLAGGCCRKAAH